MATTNAIHVINPKERMNQNISYVDSFWFKYILSSVSAIVAETVTYPLDLTKTRLQIQGERAKLAENGSKHYPYRGMSATMIGIVKEEGVLQLWKGLSPAIYRHLVYSGIRMATYEWMRDNVLKKNPDGTFPPLGKRICGRSVKDITRRRSQGLWKGWAPNVQRGALVNLGDLTTYDTAKHFFLTRTTLKDGHLVHIVSSICAGFVGATMATPADVIKSRVMNQPTDAKGRGLMYKSSVECLMLTVRNEGLFALYKGFLPIWIRMAPWSLTFWLSYEQIRKFAGTESF